MPNRIISRLATIDQRIKHKNTGCPSEFARMLHISERCLRNYIRELKELGAPIEFSKKFNSYYYKEEGWFCFRFMKETDLLL